MATSSAKRVAALAVARFGVDRARVRREVRTIASEKGEAADLIHALVDKGLLTVAQGDELRAALQSLSCGTLAPTPPPDGQLGPEAGGRTIAPRSIGGFRILRRLGEGGMAAVYLGYHEQQKRQVAVKVLADELASNPVCVEFFYRESRSSLLLDHPGIVRGITAGQDATTGSHYLVREYVDGPSGHALLDHLGRLPVGDVVHIGLEVARALEYLHSRNFVHRDIKPDNILLSRSGAVKLTDLGLLKRIGEPAALTAVQQGFGTSYYMPYEQAVNPRTVDGRSDLYALGATLYHLLTGQVPFPGDNHLEIIEKKGIGVFVAAGTLNPDVPAELERILAKTLARRSCDRYQTAAELAAELERCGLASRWPRFADLDWNEQIHGPRKPILSANQPTAMDRRRLGWGETPVEGHNAVWYLRYRDATGRWCKTKATTKQLLRRLQSGRMPASAKACRELRGPYRPLTTFPLFRETAPPPPPPPVPPPAPTLLDPIALPADSAASPRFGRLFLRLILGLGGLAMAGIVIYQLFRVE